ncbi:MAG TPA: DUF58 domain-containing protein [Opitutaceae bacterium]|nr:DUF58 domain-containing protein [Opitutaceae bacterium]
MRSATPHSALRNPQSFAALRRLEWRVRHAVETVLSGEYRSTFRGRGMEFDQVVKYEFGDDVRDIDWNVTARLGEPYRKKFVEEREVTVLILFEDSPSLQFGSAGRTKREALLELAGLVALLGAANRDRVGLVHVTPTGHHLTQPVRGRSQIMHLAAGMLGRPAPALDGPSEVPIPWEFIARAAPRHSVLLWLGDFPARPAPDGWSLLRRRYQPMCFRVDDPWDRALPDAAPFGAYDPLAGRIVVLSPRSAAERAQHAAWQAEREAAFRALQPDSLARLVVSTQDDLLDAMVRFFRARMAA